MAQPSKVSVWKAIKYWLFSLFFLALLFEMICSIIFYNRYTAGSFAIADLIRKAVDKGPDLDLYHQVHEMVRPDSSAGVSRRIADEIWDANVYSYEPWLQFRVADFKSMYVNVKGFERKSIPDRFINPASSDTLNIFFMGGSTMYGYNVSDAETIPSQFVELYKNRYPQGKSIRVSNFGIPYYYSKQELILLAKLIFAGHKPDIVVFLDGLNDFYPSRMLYYDLPHFSYAMQQVFNDQMFQGRNRSIVDTSDQFYLDIPNIPSNEYYQELADKYLNNIKHATSLADMAGAKSIFFCQPVPFYKYPNRDNDLISYKISYDRFDYIYPLLEKKADNIGNFVFLGNMLENENRLPFVDQVHYSPDFSRKIAERILLEFKQKKYIN